MTRIFLMLSVLAATLSNTQADVSVQTKGDFITVKNKLLAISIDLSCGARLGSYIYKGFNDEELIFDYNSGNGGLFKDLWTPQGWPGEFNKRKYNYKILKNKSDEVIVKTWTTSTGNYRNQIKKDLANILLEKTFSLKRSERLLTVNMAFTNKGAKGKRPVYWSQSAVDFDQKRKNNIYWRPTRHGVDWIDDEHRISACGYWFIAKALAGWNGVTNKKLKRGLMFLMDYNDLEKLYDNTASTTIEWMYDPVAIPPQKTWKTTIKLIPTEGYKGYMYADNVLICNFSPEKTPAGIKLTHTISASTLPLKDITLSTQIVGIKSKWQVTGKDLKFGKTRFRPSIKSINISGLGTMPCLIKVTITGKKSDNTGFKANYANYYSAGTGRNIEFATLGPIYEFKAPEKKKQYLKPDVIKLKNNKIPRILFIRGLWAGFHGIDEALKLTGNVKIIDGWMKTTALGETLGNFPSAYEDLLSYNLIILANVSGPMLSTVGQEMLYDFVKAGGGLMLLGGDRTYGQTTFANKNFAELLPVQCNKYGDYGKLKKAAAFKITKNNVITGGISFPTSDTVLYSHFLKPSAEAETLVSLTDKTPVLLIAKKFRVAAITLLPFGEVQPGKTMYRESKMWQRLMANTIKYLIKK